MYINDKRMDGENSEVQCERERAKITKFQRFCEFIIHERPRALVELLWYVYCTFTFDRMCICICI